MFGTASRAAHSDHIVGALVVTVAIIALADVGRAARFLNVVFGAWFIAAALAAERGHDGREHGTTSPSASR